MVMTALPSPEALATMVTNVTRTMFGLTFSLERDAPTTEPSVAWRAAVLPIGGERPLMVAIAADEEGGRTLACAMFSCTPQALDATMIDDSLSELVNIVAGQVKIALGLDAPLGLPRAATGPRAWTLERWRSATLTRGETRTVVWVAISEQLL